MGRLWLGVLILGLLSVSAFTFNGSALAQDTDLNERLKKLEEAIEEMKRHEAREREIVALICSGAGDAEISKELNLSPHTVRNHVASLYKKLGVNRRSAVVIWARERGIEGESPRHRKQVRNY